MICTEVPKAVGMRIDLQVFGSKTYRGMRSLAQHPKAQQAGAWKALGLRPQQTPPTAESKVEIARCQVTGC